MCRPFYRINTTYILVSGATFLLVQVARQTVFALSDSWSGGRRVQQWVGNMGVVILLLIIVSVLISNLVSICKLRTSQRRLSRASANQAALQANPRHATITVITLSVIFCVLNSMYIAGYLVNLELGDGDDLPLYHYAVWLFILLNSVLNPLVYFTRKRGVRLFVTQQLRSFSRAAGH